MFQVARTQGDRKRKARFPFHCHTLQTHAGQFTFIRFDSGIMGTCFTRNTRCCVIIYFIYYFCYCSWCRCYCRLDPIQSNNSPAWRSKIEIVYNRGGTRNTNPVCLCFCSCSLRCYFPSQQPLLLLLLHNHQLHRHRWHFTITMLGN